MLGWANLSWAKSWVRGPPRCGLVVLEGLQSFAASTLALEAGCLGPNPSVTTTCMNLAKQLQLSVPHLLTH